MMTAFVTVAEEGSFTKASDKLQISSQLVSKYVSQLEQHLSIRLFNRTTRRVRLTEAGEQCYQQAKSIIESVGDLEGYFGEMQESVKGVLHVSSPVSFSTLHLSPIIRGFKQQYPEVSITLELSDRKTDVIEEGFDVALRIGQLKDSSLIAKKIAPVRLVLCASPEYIERVGKPTQPSELRAQDFLRYTYMDYAQSDEPLLQVLHAIQQQKKSRFVVNNGEMLTEAAISGEGYVLQPTFIVGEALKQGKLVELLSDYEPNPIGLYVVYPHRKWLAPKLRAFIDFLSSYFGQRPYWDEF